MTSLHVIYSSMVQQFRISIGRNMFRFCVFVAPVIMGFIIGMMYQQRPNEDFVTYVVFGSGIASFWSTILFSSASDIDRERFMGTLETIFVAPCGFINIILGKIIGNTLWGMISMVINIVFVSIFFQRKIVILDIPILVLAFVLMIISYISIALMMAGAFTLSRNARLAMNCMEHPVYILCGILFPLQLLPDFIKPFSYLLSPTWSIQLLRLSVTDGLTNDKILTTSGLAGITIIYMLLCYFIYKKIDYRARVSATLGVY